MTVSVTGTGRVTAAPDVVRVRVTATALRPTVADAIAVADAAANAVRAVLATRGVTGSDASSGGFTVVAEQTWTQEGGARIVGFRCEHVLRITLRDPGTAGQALGEIVAAGGDDVRLDGVEPGIEDVAPLRVAARELAWADALDRATRLAALAGRSLGAVRQISEGAGDAGPVPIGGPEGGRVLAAKAAADTVDLHPGEVAVTVSLAVEWGLD